MSKSIKIKNTEHLKKLISQGYYDYFVALNGARSSKHIEYNSNKRKFHVLNWIDDTHQSLTEKGLFNNKVTNIGTAIELGAFYAEGI